MDLLNNHGMIIRKESCGSAKGSKRGLMSVIKVCLVAPLPPPYGGIAHWVLMVSRYASEREDIDLVVVDTAPKWRSIHNDGALLRTVGGGIQMLRDVTRLINTLRARFFEVIHLTTSGQLAVVRDLVVTHVAALFGVPLVYHIHFGKVPEIARGRSFEWWLMKRVMERASVVIVIDRRTFNAVKEFVPGATVRLIANCINVAQLPKVRKRSDGLKTAIFIGWVIPTKGVSELFEAWTKTKPDGWKLDIVGPVDEDYKKQLLSRFGEDTAEFLGQLPHAEAMEHMAGCDLFVLPSHTEGFPNVVVEAMALGKPIIATTVGAIPEMLEGGAGILIESKNVEVLEDAILQVTGDPALRKRLGELAQEKAMNNYTIDIVFEEHVACWSQASAPRGK